MTSHTYLLAHWPEDRTPLPRPVEPALLHQAMTFADAWALVAAVSRRHAVRLYLEGCTAVRAADGRLERCGIVREGGSRD